MGTETVVELEKLLEEAEAIIHEFDQRLQGYRSIPSPTWGWRTADWLRQHATLRDKLRASLKSASASSVATTSSPVNPVVSSSIVATSVSVTGEKQ